jgi:DNA-directed RNA polymerase subunit RPC12/RpoP
MASPESELPETRERRCPACQSERIVNAGNVAFEGMMVKSEHRCAVCGSAFWFVRRRLPRSIPPRGDWWTKVGPYH